MAQYNAGNLSAAASQLEALSAQAPRTFEVHELLGLVYAGLQQHEKAINELGSAVQLKPGSAVARTNLGASLAQAGKSSLAQEQFQKALALDPSNYDANHDLAELYIGAGKVPLAIPFLEAAQRADPSSYDNGYDLARAWFMTGESAKAQTLVQKLLEQKNTGELHNLLAEIEEKQGKYLEAANEYETAAHLDPSENNLFDWGSEFLLHRTYEPAVTVFERATKLYPTSARLKIGLGMALYSRGEYDQAVQALLAAADLDPSDPRSYFFLSKAFDSSPTQADTVIEHFRRFADLQPSSAQARYYYAMGLWKGKRSERADLDLHQVESLLQQAISLDPNLADAHLQLGNLYADQHQYARSMPEYQRALQLNPDLSDAHYRLAQDYVHTGQKDLAQQQFDIYQKLRAQHLAELDKERAEVRQFVYSEKAAAPSKP